MTNPRRYQYGLIEYLSESFIDYDGQEKTGLGNFNSTVDDDLKIDKWGFGKLGKMRDSYGLVFMESRRAERDRIAVSSYQYNDVLKVEIRLSGNPKTLYKAYGLYSEFMVELMQGFLANLKTDSGFSDGVSNPRIESTSYLEFSGDVNKSDIFDTIAGVRNRTTINLTY